MIFWLDTVVSSSSSLFASFLFMVYSELSNLSESISQIILPLVASPPSETKDKKIYRRRRKFPCLLCPRFSPWHAPMLSLGLCLNLISVKPSLTNEKEVMRSISALVLPRLLYQFDFLPQHSLSCDILRNPLFTQVSSKILHLIFYSSS